MSYDSLQKVAQSLSEMQNEKRNNEVLTTFESYNYEDQVKIGRCYVYLTEQEKSTKEASDKGVDVEAPVTFKVASDRLAASIELAHYQELMNDEDLQKSAAEHAAAGALAVKLLVDHVEKNK